jgi:hypothetical protein
LLSSSLLPRRVWRTHHFLNPETSQPVTKVCAIDRVPISQQIPRRLVPGKGFADLLPRPGSEHKQDSKRGHRDGEEINRRRCLPPFGPKIRLCRPWSTSVSQSAQSTARLTWQLLLRILCVPDHEFVQVRSRCARSHPAKSCPPSDRTASSFSVTHAPQSAGHARASPRSTGTP